ncbi:MAG: RimK family alpha-L-glutamate ligase [Bacteroidota bacterium]
MNIVILSKGPTLYSTQSLAKAAQKRGHTVKVLDYGRCNLFIEKGNIKVYYEHAILDNIHGVIPRIGASGTAQGASIITQFEALGVPTTISAMPLLEVRDKLHCLQKLSQHSIPTPKTVLATFDTPIVNLIHQLGGFPIVLKLLQSTHGEGVFLVNNLPHLKASMSTFHHLQERFLLQEFIAEAKGRDVRVLIVAGQVIAAMERQAKAGEFRSNLHQGATAAPTALTASEAELVKKVMQILKLEVAGIDLLRSNRGPLILEVNASPGLEGIEAITGIDVATKIIEVLEAKHRTATATSVK